MQAESTQSAPVPSIIYDKSLSRTTSRYVFYIDPLALSTQLQQDGFSPVLIADTKIVVKAGRQMQPTHGIAKSYKITLFTEPPWNTARWNMFKRRKVDDHKLTRKVVNSLAHELQHIKDNDGATRFLKNPQNGLSKEALTVFSSKALQAGLFGITDYFAFKNVTVPLIEHTLSHISNPDLITYGLATGLTLALLGIQTAMAFFVASGLEYQIDPMEIFARRAGKKAAKSEQWQKIVQIDVAKNYRNPR